MPITFPGFTKWSSTRTPVEVFRLLETLYGAFDRIASKRRVEKIETVRNDPVLFSSREMLLFHACNLTSFS
jgi:hypothetical protein